MEKEEKALQAEFAVVSKMKSKTISIPEVSAAISGFILNFEKEFQNGGIEARKMLMRKCIKSIVVDREKGVARVSVRRIPAATTWVEELLKKAEVTTKVVTSEFSGDPNYFQVTTNREFEFPIFDPKVSDQCLQITVNSKPKDALSE